MNTREGSLGQTRFPRRAFQISTVFFFSTQQKQHKHLRALPSHHHQLFQGLLGHGVAEAVLYVSAAPVEDKPGEPSNTSQSCGIGVFA